MKHEPGQRSRGCPQARLKERLLDKDGLCAVGETIAPGDVFINKEIPTNTRDLVGMGGGSAQVCMP